MNNWFWNAWPICMSFCQKTTRFHFLPVSLSLFLFPIFLSCLSSNISCPTTSYPVILHHQNRFGGPRARYHFHDKISHGHSSPCWHGSADGLLARHSHAANRWQKVCASLLDVLFHVYASVTLSPLARGFFICIQNTPLTSLINFCLPHHRNFPSLFSLFDIT